VLVSALFPVCPTSMSSIRPQKPIDWTKRAEFEALFPAYRREQIRMDTSGVVRNNIIEIKGFSLKNPYGTADLFVNTKLSIPPNKRCAVYGYTFSLFSQSLTHSVSTVLARLVCLPQLPVETSLTSQSTCLCTT
jgi:hypothetical protein